MPRKHSLHYHTSSSSLNCCHNSGWVYGFMLLMLNADPTICKFIRQGDVFPVIKCLACAVESVPAELTLTEWVVFFTPFLCKFKRLLKKNQDQQFSESQTSPYGTTNLTTDNSFRSHFV